MISHATAPMMFHGGRQLPQLAEQETEHHLISRSLQQSSLSLPGMQAENVIPYSSTCLGNDPSLIFLFLTTIRNPQAKPVVR